ncbi:MAG: hypothetical protein M0Z52_08355 [Actinomycetota bacterium]|nr:hypothetical protein [Actinomycetota bacterium]
MGNRGDRLVFSNGILILGAISAVPIIIFGGDTDALIPLNAVGVFAAFTLSQAGMVRHWYRLRGKGWIKSMRRSNTPRHYQMASKPFTLPWTL